MEDVSGTQSMSSHLIFSICTYGAVSLLPTAPGRPELFQHRDMWSIRRTQPSVPSLGCDLIFGAAAGRGSLTAIKLRDNSKKEKKKKKWGVLGIGLGGAAMVKALSLSLTCLQTASFRSTSQTSQPHLPLMSPSRPEARRVTDAALALFFFSYLSYLLLLTPPTSHIPHPTPTPPPPPNFCVSGVICWQ